MENGNNTQQLTEQIAQLQQQLAAIQRNTAPRPPKDHAGLKIFGLFFAFLFLVIGGYCCWRCFWPLNNDDEVYKSGVEAHEALSELRIFYGSTVECSETCPVCHPLLWRWRVRNFRKDY